jgi:hypothetical protein
MLLVDNIQLLTSDEVDLLIYQPRECDIHRGLLDLSVFIQHVQCSLNISMISFVLTKSC